MSGRHTAVHQIAGFVLGLTLVVGAVVGLRSLPGHTELGDMGMAVRGGEGEPVKGEGGQLLARVALDRSRYRVGEPVALALAVAASGNDEARVRFRTSQRYDFVIEAVAASALEAGEGSPAEDAGTQGAGTSGANTQGAGAEGSGVQGAGTGDAAQGSQRQAAATPVWRWSTGRMFAQVLGQTSLAPGDPQVFVVVWDQKDSRGRQVAPGRYRVRAVYTADPPVESGWREFEIRP